MFDLIEDILCIVLVKVLIDDEENNSNTDDDWQRQVNYNRRTSGKIQCLSLQPPSKSAFIFLFESKQDDALITLCGFDHASLQALHDLFSPVFNETTPFNTENGLIRKKCPKEEEGGAFHQPLF